MVTEYRDHNGLLCQTRTSIGPSLRLNLSLSHELSLGVGRTQRCSAWVCFSVVAQESEQASG